MSRLSKSDRTNDSALNLEERQTLGPCLRRMGEEPDDFGGLLSWNLAARGGARFGGLPG